jgi:hypothetical protein
MTQERFIGYSGLFIILLNIVPFANWFVISVSVLIGIALILTGSYMHWKKKISEITQSVRGHIRIPHAVEEVRNIQSSYESNNDAGQ